MVTKVYGQAMIKCIYNRANYDTLQYIIIYTHTTKKTGLIKQLQRGLFINASDSMSVFVFERLLEVDVDAFAIAIAVARDAADFGAAIIHQPHQRPAPAVCPPC